MHAEGVRAPIDKGVAELGVARMVAHPQTDPRREFTLCCYV